MAEGAEEREELCDWCEGTGLQDDEACGECNGSGKVVGDMDVEISAEVSADWADMKESDGTELDFLPTIEMVGMRHKL